MFSRPTLLVVLSFMFTLGDREAGAADAAKAAALLKEANAAFEGGKADQALKLAGEALAADPQNPEAFYVRARLHENVRDYGKAASDYTEVLKLAPKATGVYQRRGEAWFKLGRFKEAIDDFDKFIELVPGQEPHHWQRGIAHYYAQRYEDGRRQFELHQKVNQNDVENAVWHFLCVARKDGVEKARDSLIKIDRDSRVPMMPVYSLFAGKGTASEVMEAARAGNPGPGELSLRLFYAHLYLGLYYEASGEVKPARDHIMKAARGYKHEGNYMWDVARVHADLFEKTGPAR